MNSTTIFACVLGVAALGLVPASAIACHAQFNETWVNAGSVEWSGAGNDCVLEARVASTNNLPTLATVHYRRANPMAPLRVSFRIDFPLPVWNTGSTVTVVRGTAAGVPADGPSEAALFELALMGNLPGTQVRPWLLWACPDAVDGICSMGFPVALQFPTRLTLEFHSGEGGTGRLLFWEGDDTSGSPTGSIDNIDNARWAGVERVSLGLLEVRGEMPGLLNGNPVVFDQISASEPNLFWSDFELGAGVPVLANSPPVPSPSFSINGDTCTGIDTLPVVASGSTRLNGPVNIHPFVVGEDSSTEPVVSIAAANAGARAFLCTDPVSPTSPCTAIARSGSPIQPAPGRYVLVVGNVDAAAACFAYALNTGPLTP